MEERERKRWREDESVVYFMSITVYYCSVLRTPQKSVPRCNEVWYAVDEQPEEDDGQVEDEVVKSLVGTKGKYTQGVYQEHRNIQDHEEKAFNYHASCLRK